jgi:hypothetical protein
MSFDKLRTNGKLLIPFVVMLSTVEASNHERNPLIESLPKSDQAPFCATRFAMALNAEML